MNPGESLGLPRRSAMTAATMGSATPGGGDIAFGAVDLEDIARAAGADCISALACGRASFSYHRLPEPSLRLTIRKLDDSYFDVQIARSAAVWELKAAIEAVFIALFYDMDNAITWQHVWSHFCLCFKDEKLTDDRATLRAFGIKDGDELSIYLWTIARARDPKAKGQHLTEAQIISSGRSRTSVDDFGVRSRTLLDDLIEEDEAEKLTTTRHSTSALEEGFGVYQQHEECMAEGGKKGSFFSNWFSYSRLRGNRRTHSEDAAAHSSCEKKADRPKLGKWLSSKKSKAQRK